MRLFVAVDVPEDLKRALDDDICSVLRPELPDARWTRPEGRHLTLKFLGEVPDDRVGAVVEALERAASTRPPFSAAFDRIGAFPNLRRPRVVWVGVGEGAEAMASLASAISDELVPLGFATEDRPFTAHLTLCRFKVPGPVGELPPVTAPDRRFDVRDVVLFRSQLHPRGARYTVLERVALAG